MATTIGLAAAVPVRTLSPDRYEKLLSVGAVVLGVAMIAAIVRGRTHWAEVPSLVWLHLLTIAVAVALTPTMLLSRRGTRRHRLLGRIWAGAMLLTALLSFGIRDAGSGGFSAIHLLSVATLVLVPRLWWSARTHQVVVHRRMVRGVVTGGLLIAGFFTFPFGRLLGSWLFAPGLLG